MVGKSRVIVVSMPNNLFLYYYFLIIVLFSIQKTADVLLPHPVLPSIAITIIIIKNKSIKGISKQFFCFLNPKEGTERTPFCLAPSRFYKQSIRNDNVIHQLRH